MKKHKLVSICTPAFAVLACVALPSATFAQTAQTAQTPKPPAAPQPAPVTPPNKGYTTLLTTDAQVNLPAFAALRGVLTADKKALKDGEPIAFTYSVTNTSKTESQTLNFSTGQRFELSVTPKGGTPVWQMSRSRMFTMSLGVLTFAPGETKTFAATWKPAPGEIKPGLSYTAAAHLTPTVKGKPGGSSGATPPAHATLPLTAAK